MPRTLIGDDHADSSESTLTRDTGDRAEAESPDERLLTVFLRILGALGLLGLALLVVVVANIL